MGVVTTAKAIALGVVASAVCAVAGSVAGFWAGVEWQQGRAAQNENQTLRTDVQSLLGAAVELRARGVEIAQDFRTAYRVMETINREHDQRARDSRTFFARQADALGALVAKHPGLSGDCLDTDGMQHWNTAAGGPRATGATTANPSERTRAVPERTPHAEQRDGSGDSAGLGSGGGAIPLLRRPPTHGGRAHRRVRARGMATLLPGDRRARDHRARLRGDSYDGL